MSDSTNNNSPKGGNSFDGALASLIEEAIGKEMSSGEFDFDSVKPQIEHLKQPFLNRIKQKVRESGHALFNNVSDVDDEYFYDIVKIVAFEIWLNNQMDTDNSEE
jgi:hypothetical protein